MEAKSIEKAARLLLDTRKKKYQIGDIPVEYRPTNLEEAYAVQGCLFELIGSGHVGWFLGGTNTSESSEHGAIKFLAPILDGALHESPVELSQEVFMTWYVDVEYGFTFASDVFPRDTPYSFEEILSFVASIHPTLDIVNSQYKDLSAIGLPSMIANIGADGAIIRGSGTTNWSASNLVDHEATLFVNGNRTFSGTGRTILGNPVNALMWCVNHLSKRGQKIGAGKFVATGSCTEVYDGRLHDRVIADFGELGSVEATFLP